jgi:lipoprotein-anchoring transpeptidase ErfK/SrfK
MAGYNPLSTDNIKIEKLIKVSLAKQQLDYYFGDKLFGSFPISSGVKSMPSPVGEFKVLDKVPVKFYSGANYSYPNTKWNLHFYTKKYRYYIHGAYWHNNFGKPMSHGCINVAYENMEPLYAWAQIDTKIIIE